jgi:hypothetical protein
MRKIDLRAMMENSDYIVGDDVRVGDKEDGVTGVVRVPDGPGDTIGVLIDGELEMEHPDDLERIDPEEECDDDDDDCDEDESVTEDLNESISALRGLAGIPDTVITSSRAPQPYDNIDFSFMVPGADCSEPECEVEVIEIEPDTVAEEEPAPEPQDNVDGCVAMCREAVACLETGVDNLPVGEFVEIRNRLIAIVDRINESQIGRRKKL